MRTPRIIIIVTFLFTSFILTYLSLRSSHTDDSVATRTEPQGGLRSFFSFQTPLSLFPPNAIISLTDDNTTSFLARPAAFGPLLPAKGLSGQLWIGSGFGDDSLRQGAITSGAEGELGCSDVPGWIDGHAKPGPVISNGKSAKSVKTSVIVAKAKNQKRDGDDAPNSTGDDHATAPYYPADNVKEYDPTVDDGTDDYLHRPAPGSTVKAVGQESHEASANAKGNHADIQSIQEGAEIAGKIVILSRGGCGFLEKVKWVQRRGGIALIVGDDTRGGPLIQMYARGDTSNVTIPSVFTSHTTAHLLSSLIPPGSYMEDTIDDDGNVAVKVQQSKGPNKDGKKGKKAGSKPNSQITAGTPRATSTSRPKSNPVKKVTSTPPVAEKPDENPSWIRSWFTKSSSGKSTQDGKPAKSSSNSDWVLVTEWDEDNDVVRNTPAKSANSVPAPKKPSTLKSEGKVASGDDFLIGVQDWRDPDLVIAPNTQEEAAFPPSGDHSADKKSPARILHTPPANSLPGGSSTSENGDKATSKSSIDSISEGDGSDSDNRGFLYRLFGDDDDESEAITMIQNHEDHEGDVDEENEDEHEGLWVTLTPTSAASPFFDTLLVLVVSPLVTLTVVYALLLLRSRIRRRRWRAPKSVVERLPVRTYQTIPPSVPQTRQPSPANSSPSTPLLQQQQASTRPRPRSRTTSGIPESGVMSRSNSDLLSPTPRAPSRNREHEKPASGLSEWKKYMGRQVECVVCLEEYVDGVSQVMSLPCGHEFHVDCITPWLTTRRRTCPICKGDVVRSLARGSTSSPRYEAYHDDMDDDIQSQAAETINNSPSAALPIFRDADSSSNSDVERGIMSPTPTRPRSTQGSGWRNLVTSSLGSLSRSPPAPQEDRNR